MNGSTFGSVILICSYKSFDKDDINIIVIFNMNFPYFNGNIIIDQGLKHDKLHQFMHCAMG